MEASKARSIVKRLRNRVTDGRYTLTVTKQQQQTQKASKLRFPSWISQVEFPVPAEQDLDSWLSAAIRHLGDGTESIDAVKLTDVKAEWIGLSRDANIDSQGLSEEKKYASLLNDCTSDVVLLHVHGGAF